MKPFALIAIGLLLLFGVPELPEIPRFELPSWTILAPKTEATAAVYVFEKDDGPVPGFVTVAVNRLNIERKILATLFEADDENGNREVPAQYRAPLAAAKAAGIPALVVMAGEKVIRVIPKPATEDEIWRAVP